MNNIVENNVANDIGRTCNFLNDSSNSYFSNFSSISSMYSFTTENIKGYYEKINFKNKKVLCVASSGDHAFNAILNGAKNVDTFDINKLCKYYISLKKSGIIELDYDDFLSYFSLMKRNEELYLRMRKRLDEDSRRFWDAIIFHGYNMNKMFRYSGNKAFGNDIPYINFAKYKELKKVIENVNIGFIESGIDILPSKLDNKYDIILLSNISGYLDNVYRSNTLKAFRSLIDTLINYLNDDGLIAVGYIYNICNNMFYSMEDTFDDYESRRIYFPDDIFDTIIIESYNDKSSYDGIVTYNKCKSLIRKK